MAKIVRRSSILVNNTNPSELVVRYPGNDDHFLQTLLVGVFVLVLYEIDSWPKQILLHGAGDSNVSIVSSFVALIAGSPILSSSNGP